MTRNEMITHIVKKSKEEVFENKSQFLDVNFCNEQVVGFFLNLVEEAGMLPPELKDEGWYMKKSGEMVYGIYKWEPEDD